MDGKIPKQYMHLVAAAAAALLLPMEQRCPSVRCTSSPDTFADFCINLTKPLGIVFDELEPGGFRGLTVAEVLPDGSAAASTFVWPGDELLALNGNTALATSDFDDAMAALQAAPETLEMTFRRRGHVACLDFPDGKRTFGVPGDVLSFLCKRAKYRDVKYGCSEGTCGTCEMVLVNGDTDQCKSVRVCRSQLGRLSPTAQPWRLLQPDAPEAQAYFRALQKKAAE